MKCRLDTRDKQFVSINKFCMRIMHNSAMTLCLLPDKTAEDDVDKHAWKELYRFLIEDSDNVFDMARLYKPASQVQDCLFFAYAVGL